MKKKKTKQMETAQVDIRKKAVQLGLPKDTAAKFSLKFLKSWIERVQK